MTVNESDPTIDEQLSVINSLTESDTEKKALVAGYLIGMDPTREVRFEGQALPQFFGGLRLRYLIDESEIKDEDWPTEDGERLPGKPMGFSEDPAFVLGAAIAACRLKNEGIVEPSRFDDVLQDTDQ